MTKVLLVMPHQLLYVRSSNKKKNFSTLFGSSGENFEKLSIMKNVNQIKK